MKDCRDIEPLKAPFVDGDTAPSDRAAVEAHLTRCGRCRDDVAVERAAREALAARRDDLRPLASEHLKQRCVAHAASAMARGGAAAAGVVKGRVPVYRRWVPMSVAATLVLALTGVFMFGLTQKSQALAFQMTLDHVKCARFTNEPAHVDTAVEEQRWLAKYGWPVRVAASSPEVALRLRAVRRCAVTDGRVAHLLYDWQGRPLSVYILPVDAIHGSAEVHRFGHDAVIWAQNGRTYVLLSRARRRPDLDGLVRYVKANVY